jgi:hypothetical protein
MAAVWLAYLSAIPLFFPAYVGTVLPLVFDHYLALGGLTWWQTILTERLGTALLALLPLAVLAFAAPLGALPRVLALAGLGAALAAVVQSKGWTYHALPVRLLAGLLGVVLAARWMDGGGLAPGRAGRAAPGVAALAAFALMLHALAGAEAPWRQITWGWSRAGLLSEAIGRVAPQGRVLVLSPDIFPVWPALTHAGAESTLPTMSLWLLQGAYADCPAGGAPRALHAPGAMPAAERLLFRSVVEDFAADPPEAVLVSRNPGIPDCGGAPFDLIGYFARDPRFAVTFRRYRPVRDLAVEGYQLYRREF